MKKSNILCFNRKIKDAIENGVKPRNIGRLYPEALQDMIEEVYSKELSLMTFEVMADMYSVDFKMYVEAEYNGKKINKISTNEDMIWIELDKEYNELTGKELNSNIKCYRELYEKFRVINGSIYLEGC